MPLVDCKKLLDAKKLMEPKVLAEALVNRILPEIDEVDIENKLLECINKGLPAEVPIFEYQATELLVNGSTPVDGFLNATVASRAHELCDCLPCGTAIGKALSGWAALELLSTAIGPNIRVYKKKGELVDSCPYYNVHMYTLVARLEDKPLKRSASAVLWWPNADKLTIENQTVVWPPINPPINPSFNNRQEIVDYLTRTFGEPPTPLEVNAEMASRGAGFSRDPRMPRMPPALVTAEPGDRYDSECSYCHEMESICGGDHGDDMRWEALNAERDSRA